MYGIRRTQKLANPLKDIWVFSDNLVLACYHLVGLLLLHCWYLWGILHIRWPACFHFGLALSG